MEAHLRSQETFHNLLRSVLPISQAAPPLTVALNFADLYDKLGLK